MDRTAAVQPVIRNSYLKSKEITMLKLFKLIWDKCGACNGRGATSDGQPCRACYGTGEVSR